MVDMADISRVNSLIQIYTNYRQAISTIDDNGRIGAFVIVGPNGSGSQITSEGINYPPQMMEAIRYQIEDRLRDIERDLSELGVNLNGQRR